MHNEITFDWIPTYISLFFYLITFFQSGFLTHGKDVPHKPRRKVLTHFGVSRISTVVILYLSVAANTEFKSNFESGWEWRKIEKKKENMLEKITVIPGNTIIVIVTL